MTRSVQSGFVSIVVAYLILFLSLATLPDTTATSAALGVLLVAVVATAAVVVVRSDLVAALFGGVSGPENSGRRLRGAFRRQQRPDEAGRPMARAPGALVGAL